MYCENCPRRKLNTSLRQPLINPTRASCRPQLRLSDLSDPSPRPDRSLGALLEQASQTFSEHSSGGGGSSSRRSSRSGCGRGGGGGGGGWCCLKKLPPAIFTLLTWLLWTNGHREDSSAILDEEMYKQTTIEVRSIPLDTNLYTKE